MDKTDFELHIPGMNFCGPGTNFRNRLEEDGVTPKAWSKPVDRVDEISFKHDMFYNLHKGTRERCEADADMIKELKNITNPTCKERIERGIAVMCLSVKRFFVLAWIRLDNLISNINN
jgi:Phospholipase A2-like domain